MSRRNLYLVVVVVVLALALAGCSWNKILPESTGSLQVSITIPKDLVPVQSRGTLDGITISKVNFTITDGTRIHNKTETVSGGTVTTVFPNLQPGNWTIDVLAIELGSGVEYEIFKGNGTGTVLVNKVTTVPVDMNLVNGNMSLVVAFPDGYTEAESIKITLTNGVFEPLVREVTITEGTDPIVFTDLLPTGWNVKVEAFDSSANLCAEGSKVIDIKPGRTVDVTLGLGLGTITIETSWNMPPNKPINLVATKAESAIDLTWEASPSVIKGYSVARSTAIDGEKVRLTETLITECKYTDTSIYEGDTYYYWVSAYAEDGLYSGWLGSEAITF